MTSLEIVKVYRSVCKTRTKKSLFNTLKQSVLIILYNPFVPQEPLNSVKVILHRSFHKDLGTVHWGFSSLLWYYHKCHSFQEVTSSNSPLT